MTRTVQCVVLKIEAEGLDKPPHPGELGQRIFENVSQEGWGQWLERLTTIINENGLSTADEKAIELIGYTYHNLHKLHFTALRFFSVYGPRARPDMMPYTITDSIVRDKTITLFEAGRMKRDWTYVQDIAAGVEAALDRPLGYEIINLGRGEPVLMADFVHIVEEQVGKKAKLDTPPAPASELKINFANIDKARRLLGYNPTTDVHTGMTRLWEWYQREYL